jgi:hypothetical protein
LKDADKIPLQAHTNVALKILAAGFADQKRSAYGFGPSANLRQKSLKSFQCKNLTKFHTHSKSIENAFGHMDNLLRQTRAQGFAIAVQSMQIASAKDLVFGNNHSWWKMPMQMRLRLKDMQLGWNASQQKLLASGVKDSDVSAL